MDAEPTTEDRKKITALLIIYLSALQNGPGLSDGSWAAANVWHGIPEGEVAFAPFNPRMPAEVQAEADYVPHHPKKIILILSAMRKHAQALRGRATGGA